MLNNLIIFFFTTIFFQASILGYSLILFRKIHFSRSILINNYIKYIYSIIIISFVGFFLYIFSIKDFIFIEIFWIIGFLFFLINIKRNFKNNIIEFFFIFILFSGLVISKTHDDFIAYHLRYIYHITENSLILGSGNIEVNYTYTPFFSYFQKMFVNNYFSYNLLHIPIFLVFSNFISFLFRVYKENKFYSKFILIFLIFFITKYSRIADFGYNSLSTFFIISLLLIFLIEKKEKKYSDIIIYITIFSYCVYIKVTSLFFLPVILIIIFQNNNKFYLNYNTYLKILIFLLLLFCLILDSILKSGCIFYFLNFTCLNQEIVPWVINNEILNNFALHAELWAKGFYHQKVISNKLEYLQNFNWIRNWINIHFFYKVIEYLVTIIFIIFFVISLTANFTKSNLIRLKNFISFEVIACLVSIYLWFIFLPQLRFGEGLIIAIFLVFLNKSYEMIYLNKNSKNTFVIFIIISITIYNFKNFYRIYLEFSRNDEVYKFTNFPYPARINQDIKEWRIVNNKFIETQIIKKKILIILNNYLKFIVKIIS